MPLWRTWPSSKVWKEILQIQTIDTTHQTPYTFWRTALSCFKSSWEGNTTALHCGRTFPWLWHWDTLLVQLGCSWGGGGAHSCADSTPARDPSCDGHTLFAVSSLLPRGGDDLSPDRVARTPFPPRSARPGQGRRKASRKSQDFPPAHPGGRQRPVTERTGSWDGGFVSPMERCSERLEELQRRLRADANVGPESSNVMQVLRWAQVGKPASKHSRNLQAQPYLF